jgi:peptide deformylase
MAILPIRCVPDEVLRQKAKRVRVVSPSVQKLIDDMVETMRSAAGAGLAAPQVGVLLRVIVVEMPEEGLIALVNPEVVKNSGERDVIEGCLSVPGYQGKIKRSVSVTVKGRDRDGKEIRVKAKELLAQGLEHEIDHLNGVLYTDYVESDDKLWKVEPVAPTSESKA